MRKTILLVIAGVLMFACAAYGEEVNIAPKCRILVSDVANPAWDSRNVADNDIGPTKGWLGAYGVQNPPWVRFIFPYPTAVTSIRVLPASYTELEWGRFSRPKKISVLLKGDTTDARQFDLADKEDVFKELPINMKNVYEVSIVINEIYPGRKYPEQTGFQEVQIMVPEASDEAASGAAPGGYETRPNPAAEAREALDKTAAAVAPGAKEEDKTAEKKPKGTISPDEQEILDLIKELLTKLEQKFMED
jgi:hypothetical protein